MIRVVGTQNLAIYLLFACLVLMLAFSAPTYSVERVFKGRQKALHELTGVELERIKTEHRLKFGVKEVAEKVSYKSFRPWRKKSQQAEQPEKQFDWGECRDYALYKRNSCYRDGRGAYQCEQAYEVRFRLCDE